MIKVLFLAANPRDHTQLNLYKELFEVSSEVNRAYSGVEFEFVPNMSVQWRDMSELLKIHKPDILHFSGHGSEADGLVFEDEHGNAQAVGIESIKTVFRLLKGNIRCVILNACYTEDQASEIAQHIDCVIGIPTEIDDQEAINFARELYRQLASGESVLDSYKLGCTHVKLGERRVKLIHPHSNVSTIRFVRNESNPGVRIGPIHIFNTYLANKKSVGRGWLATIALSAIALTAAAVIGYYWMVYPLIPPVPPPLPPTFCEMEGLIVMEAEHFEGKIPGSGNAANVEWELQEISSNPAQFVLQANPKPNDSYRVYTGRKTFGPALFYRIIFESESNYYVYIRGGAPSEDPGRHDSIHVGLAGEIVATNEMSGTIEATGISFNAGKLNWQNVHLFSDMNPETLSVAQKTIITVSESSKPYLLFIWMRESGVIVDKIILSKAEISNTNTLDAQRETLCN